MSAAIREKLGIAYALNAVSASGVDTGSFVFYVGTTRDKLDIARDELFKLIDSIKADGITDKELKDAKTQLAGLQRIALQDNGSIALTASLDELYGLGYDYFTKYESRLNSVTAEDVKKAANKYLRPDSYVLVLLKGK
ncbi:MAG: insulinase family protein, partial [Candidatus Omnitrophota bacterium]